MDDDRRPALVDDDRRPALDCSICFRVTRIKPFETINFITPPNKMGFHSFLEKVGSSHKPIKYHDNTVLYIPPGVLPLPVTQVLAGGFFINMRPN